MSQFKGYGRTLDEAIDAAAEEALKSRKPGYPDELVSLELKSVALLYGGIVGHHGTRVATVSVAGKPVGMTVAAADSAAAPAPALSLHLDVIPEVTWADLMPPVRRPQPRTVGLVFTVTNTGQADFQGQSPDSGVARFAVLNGRTQIWSWPEIVSTVVTPVRIRPAESLTFKATWDMSDSTALVAVDLRAVARFVPSGESAIQKIVVKAAY